MQQHTLLTCHCSSLLQLLLYDFMHGCRRERCKVDSFVNSAG
jgi:hypothetical protein